MGGAEREIPPLVERPPSSNISFLIEREQARLRPGAYHRICNHCGGEFANPASYLRHCEDQARARGHGAHPNCPDIRTCSWVRLNVASLEWAAVYGTLSSMSRLVPREITNPFDARLMWVDFMAATAPEERRDAYGPTFPRPAFYGDKLFSFQYKVGPASTVAWGRITPEPEETAVWLGLGVYPDFRGSRLQEEIRAWLVNLAFNNYEYFKVSQVRVGVRCTNRAHLDRWMARVLKPDSPWVWSGLVWHPDPFHIFTLTREAYLRAQSGLLTHA